MNRTIQETMDNLVPRFRLEAREHLSRLSSTGQRRALQEATITQAAISRVITGGYDKKAFWQRKDVSARSTFNKWKKHQPEFTAVFDDVCELAMTWRNNAALDSLEEALTLIQLHAPEAAWKTIELMRGGLPIDAQQRMAAQAILDRASVETADKSGDKSVEIPQLDTLLDRIYGDDDSS